MIKVPWICGLLLLFLIINNTKFLTGRCLQRGAWCFHSWKMEKARIIFGLIVTTCNSNSTDKPEVASVLILLPPHHQCSILRVFKLLELHKMERSRSKDVRSRDQTRDLLHKGHARTYCAIFAPSILHHLQSLVCMISDSPKLALVCIKLCKHSWHVFYFLSPLELTDFWSTY